MLGYDFLNLHPEGRQKKGNVIIDKDEGRVGQGMGKREEEAREVTARKGG
jgi:hypothetical protein